MLICGFSERCPFSLSLIFLNFFSTAATYIRLKLNYIVETSLNCIYFWKTFPSLQELEEEIKKNAIFQVLRPNTDKWVLRKLLRLTSFAQLRGGFSVCRSNGHRPTGVPSSVIVATAQHFDQVLDCPTLSQLTSGVCVVTETS